MSLMMMTKMKVMMMMMMMTTTQMTQTTVTGSSASSSRNTKPTIIPIRWTLNALLRMLFLSRDCICMCILDRCMFALLVCVNSVYVGKIV